MTIFNTQTVATNETRNTRKGFPKVELLEKEVQLKINRKHLKRQ